MAWTVLQSASGAGVGPGTNTVQFGSNCSAGSVIVAYCANARATAVADANSNSFTEVVNYVGAIFNSVWTLTTPAGDVGTRVSVKATINSGNSTMLIQEISGISAALDGTAGVSNGSSTGSIGPPVYASTGTNEFLAYLCASGNSSETITGPAGYTLDPNSITSSGFGALAVAYKNSTHGTESGQYSVAGGGGWNLNLFAFSGPATQYSVPLTAAVSATPSVQRSIGRLLTAVMNMQAQVRRSIGKTLTAAVSLAASATASIPNRAAVFAVRQGIVFTRWVTGTISKYWRVFADLPGTDWEVSSVSLVMSAESTAYITVPVQAPSNPIALPVQFAFMPTPSQVPGVPDWVAASWETAQGSPLTEYEAACLVGPSGTVSLGTGTYSIYVKITATPEVPVLYAGSLQIM